ncbi:MAG TPA: 30S ribosomal protein S7 [Candidatus Paceibacterota bacterium]|jgi:small subunit ribosomal protein S7|nr:30S ribosomal protein S7 [Candidatus Paceibacterota bacterium]HOH11522.1 30S ribosomal protein S7 [Candidatus Paceibacterota bacterium]HOY11315.1 30S ribosomal protein S7 [Candidatus Paceibacterota bacterium]HPB60411.1 30S ribosomal protein S7 [Candidatus Paceibacterota bacterium]HPI24781.1 30S ribosomal protein S7 [Candidatus Paceibacterota bacterium]
MRRPVKKRPPVGGDYVYHSEKVEKLINYIMERGKKNAARKIVYGAFDLIKEKTKTEPLEVFETAIQNVAPNMEIRSRRVGGANYQVPHEVRPERKLSLAFRWLIEAAKSKKGKPMAEKLSEEILAAKNNEGDAVRKRENVHKMAEANRAFAHFAIRRSK